MVRKELLFILFILFIPFKLFAVVVFEDDFERDALSPWTTTNTSMAGIGTYTSDSGTRSLYTRYGVVSVTSPIVDLTGSTSATIDMWIRRGSDAFSEDPDSGEDFIVEYLSDTGVWQRVAIYYGSGTSGEIINLSYSLPSDAYHSSFQIKVRQTGGSGTGWDYWHVDGVKVTAELAPKMSLTKSSCVIDDPINGTSNPKRTSGSTIRYAIEVKNEGAVTVNDVKVDDSLANEFDTSTIENLQIQSGACDCLGVSSASNNGVNGTGNGVNPVVLDFGDIAGGTESNPTIECGYFEVKLF